MHLRWQESGRLFRKRQYAKVDTQNRGLTINPARFRTGNE